MIQRSNLESSFSQNMQTHVILFFDIFAFAVFKFSQFLIFGVGVDTATKGCPPAPQLQQRLCEAAAWHIFHRFHVGFRFDTADRMWFVSVLSSVCCIANLIQ